MIGSYLKNIVKGNGSGQSDDQGKRAPLRYPLSVNRALVATVILATVPLIAVIGFFLTVKVQSFFESPVILATVMKILLGWSIGLLFYSCMILCGYWCQWLMKRFNVSRTWVWLIVVPFVIIGPLYYFGMTCIVSYKLKQRKALYWGLPGILAGYGLLAELDQILLGAFDLTWEHVFETPVLLGTALVSGVLVLKELSGQSPSRKAWRWSSGFIAVWLGLQAILWIQTARYEAMMGKDLHCLEEFYGAPLTYAGLREAYLSDGQRPVQNGILLDDYLHRVKQESASEGEAAAPLAPKAVPAAEQQDASPLPVMPPPELLLALDQGEPDAKTAGELQLWLLENEPLFEKMDQASEGDLLKVDLPTDHLDETMCEQILPTMMAWAGIYRVRLYLALQNRQIDEAWRLLKHVKWLRDSVLADPFSLAVWGGYSMELMYLDNYSVLLSSGLLSEERLSELEDELSMEETRWAEHSKEAEWASAAWYMVCYQQNMKHRVTRENFIGDIIVGYAGGTLLYQYRRDGAMALRNLVEHRDEPLNSFENLLLRRKTLVDQPTLSGLAKNLMVVRHQYVIAQAKQRALRCAVAIERYRLLTGRKPTALQELVPEFLPEVLQDPYDGQPMKYRSEDFIEVLPNPEEPSQITERTVKGYQLYSVGQDQMDNGGRPYQKNGSQVMRDVGIAVKTAGP